ncbi:MAG: SUMF1/EgtB/PvdO family nonheme iron enzyme [Nitrospinota bacterium]|nr:SUMF1/EgtB/PvdO family nonheme iron enzyme [Nitrospinota bacterium]
MKTTHLILVAIVSVFLINCEYSFSGEDTEAWYPAGEFWMGSNEGEGQPDEHPRHKVYLDEFTLDKYEVTGKEFEAYLAAHPKEHPTITGWNGRKVRRGMGQVPVIGLTWKRCVNFCAWKGKRLPTEAEWERAAAGLTGRRYPWGNEPPDPERANFNKCCFIMKGNVLEKVGHYESGKTPEGIYDLAGNIAEWVHDWYHKEYYENSEYKNPRGPKQGKFHVIRGGAWNSLATYMRSADRYGYNDGKDFYGIGCRCARRLSPMIPRKEENHED